MEKNFNSDYLIHTKNITPTRETNDYTYIHTPLVRSPIGVFITTDLLYFDLLTPTKV